MKFLQTLALSIHVISGESDGMALCAVTQGLQV